MNHLLINELLKMKTRQLIGFSVLVSLLLLGCGSKKARTENDKFSLTDKMEKIITIDSVKYTTVENELKLTGKVTFDEDKVTKVFPVVSGVVTEIKAGIGDNVQKGQVLAVIKSTEMAGIENDLNKAGSDYEIARKNLEVMEDMYKGGIASGKELITAQEELQKAGSDLKKATNVSDIFGGDGKTVYYIKSPINGVIVDKNLSINMQIRTDYSESLFTISDLKNVWVMVNVFETDISKVKPDYNVEITTLSYPGQIIKGKIDQVYNVLDPVSKVMKARVRLANTNYQLKPEMFTNVILHYSEETPKLTVPSQAVIFDNSTNYVLVYRSRSDIEIREVKIYKSVNDKTYIDSGIKPGEKVIVNDNLLIYEELTDRM